MIQEELIHYLWQTQQFDKKDLQVVSGEELQVMKVGHPNKGAGPDFLHSTILLNSVSWRGDIEIHKRSSDWYAHKHAEDKRYNSVILHVVWEDNQPVLRADGTKVPTLTLKDRVDPALLTTYQKMMKGQEQIPCSRYFAQVPDDIREKMLEKALFQRFKQRYRFVEKLLRKNNQDTETTTYQLLGYNFGFKVNSEPFLSLVEHVPFELLRQHRPNLLYLEAILLGQAGLLKVSEKEKKDLGGYEKALIEAYTYLKRKHGLEAMANPYAWNFFRLRPANFPTIRITQFARLIHAYPNLFSLLVNHPPTQLKRHLAIQQSSYWQTHYQLGKKSDRKIGGLGKSSIENILINTVVPLLVTYGKLRDNDFFIDKGISLLRSLHAEDNVIIRKWHDLGFQPKDAFESQASIELFTKFCQPKKCLSCGIGKHLLQKSCTT
ncbi:MAG: DUF2851 family protein [Bacteroidota bacterium]